MTKLLIFILLIFSSKNIFSNDFNNFIRKLNSKDTKTLRRFDYHAKNIGLINFQGQYLTEISKELFGKDIYSNNKRYIVSKKSYSSQKPEVLKKVAKKYQYIIQQLCEDIESFISGNQYTSLEKFNSYPTTRLTKPVRSNLKKVRLLSKVWLFLYKSNSKEINEALTEVVNMAQKRVLLLASLSSGPPENYSLTVFQEAEEQKEENTTNLALNSIPGKIKPLEQIVREKSMTETTKTKKLTDKNKPNTNWKPKEEPSYISLIDMFLNTPSQSNTKQAKYIAPKTLPKPSNDW
jgi:hypothetical protein